MKQIALFARVSTLGQTLEQQVDELVKIAEREGYPSKKQIVIQEKESGRKLKYDARKTLHELEDMINDIDCVVVYELSRLARRADVMYQVRDLLIENKVQLICMNPYMRLLDEQGNMTQSASLIFSIFTSLAESEMDIKIERMKRGKEYKMRQNGYGGGGILYGYKSNDDKIVVDEEQASVVRRIFSMMITRNISARQIAKELMEEGVIEHDNLCAGNNFVAKIIRRTDYYGVKARKINYEYPPIIDKETFDNANKIMDTFKRKMKSMTKNIYYGKKIVYEKQSEGLMTGLELVGGALYTTAPSNSIHCSINVNLVDSLLWYCTINHKNSVENTSKIRKQLANDINILSNRINNSQKTITNEEVKIDHINKRIISGKMDESKGDVMIDDIQKNVKKLKSQVLEMVMLLNQKNDMLQDIINGNGLDCSGINNDEERYKLIHEEIDKFYVEKIGRYKGTFEVLYKSGDKETFDFNWNCKVKSLIHDGKNISIPLLNRY